MADDERYAQLEERWRRDRTDDDVIGDRRDPHPQDETNQHRQDERQQQMLLADRKDITGKRRRSTRQRQHADDHPNDRTSHANG